MAYPDDLSTNPGALRQRAEHYRELGAKVTDARATAAAKELADQYDALATELDAGSKDQVFTADDVGAKTR